MTPPVRFTLPRASLRWLRRLSTFAVIAACLFLLWDRAQAIDAHMVRQAFAQTSLAQWVGALLATCVSYAAFGRYEAHWHQLRNTGIPPARARQIGMAAAAIGQTFGFGAVTGAMARIRIMGRENMMQTLTLSAAISLSFMVCLALIAAPLAALSGIAVSPVMWGVIALAAFILALNLPRMRSPIRTALGVRTAMALLGLTIFDVVAMGVAFYLLLPATVTMSPVVVVAAFAIALGAGLLSNAPGGIGAFDLTLCLLLAPLGDSTVIITLFAFRLINHLIPAGIALIWLAFTAQNRRSAAPPPFAPADWGMHRQGAQVTQTGRVLWLTRLAFGMRIAIGAGIGGTAAEQIAAARGNRSTDTRLVALYKAPGRTAAAAKAAGWRVRRIASDAVIDIARWDMASPARKRLRRNVRQAEKAGVTVSFDVSPHDWPELARVATLWASEHGGELGFSMGRYDRAYLEGQTVCVIRHNKQVIGFISLHRGTLDWSLDLIRQINGIPEGTMHLAICAAIAEAKLAGVRQLSLGAVPHAIPGDRISSYFAQKRSGLARFKSCFKPRWVPLYIAAPNAPLLIIASIAIILSVHRPIQRAIWRLKCGRAMNLPKTQHDHEPFSVDTNATSWQAMTDTPQGPRAL